MYIKKTIIAVSILVIFACEKYGKELNHGKDGCIDCVLRFDTITSSDTTSYELTYPTWNLKTDRTDWCHYLNEMNGNMQTIDTIFIKQTAYCK
ncbi:MAG TPA: hypothetical protein PLS10_01900 [Chitinophagales bacterium]|nr:hypothetical protein [Chitinophagales bacterium]